MKNHISFHKSFLLRAWQGLFWNKHPSCSGKRGQQEAERQPTAHAAAEQECHATNQPLHREGTGQIDEQGRQMQARRASPGGAPELNSQSA